MLLLVLNLAGTFAFGLSGGMAGVRARLDLFGVVVLAVVVGLAGGITRDLLIGVPPATIRDWRYLAVAGAAGLVTLLPTRSSAGLEGRSTCWTRPDSRSSASLVRVPHSTMASPPYPPSSSARSRASAAASSATFSSARSPSCSERACTRSLPDRRRHRRRSSSRRRPRSCSPDHRRRSLFVIRLAGLTLGLNLPRARRSNRD